MDFIFIVLLAASVVNASENVCEPGSLFKDYCNTCSCAENGQSFACTMMDCDKDFWNKDGSLKMVQESEELNNVIEKKLGEMGTLLKGSCNSCSCSIVKSCSGNGC